MKTILDSIQVLSTFVILAVIVGFPLYAILKRVPVRFVHAIGAAMFLVLGVLALI